MTPRPPRPWPALLVLLLALLGAAAPALAAQDDRRVHELEREIAEKGDQTPPALFEELGKMRTGAAYIVLKNALRDLRNANTKRYVYSALRHMADDPDLGSKALGLVVKAARSRDDQEARAAAGALGYFGPAGYPAMYEVVEHAPDAVARARALRGLVGEIGKSPTAEHLELVLGAVQVPDTGTRQAVVDLLRRFRSEESFEEFTRVASGKGEPALQRLVVDAMAGHPFGAGGVVDEGADKVLSEAAGSKDLVLQYYALTAMARRGGTFDLRLVDKLAKAKDPTVRRAALLVAIRAGGERSDPVAMARSRDVVERQAAAIGLGEATGPESLDALIGLLTDEDRVVRAEAIRQIAQRGALDAVDELIARLAVEEGRLRADLRGALEAMTGRDYGLNARVWERFWEAEGKGFVPPSPEERAKAAEERRAKPTEDQRSQVAFYGIEIVSNRFALVIDTSGSMSTKAYTGPTRIEVAKDQLARTIERLRDGVLFNVIPFDTRVRTMEDEMVAADERSRAEALAFAEGLAASGGTNIHDGLLAAFEDERVDTVYLLSDGAPSAGPIVDPTQLREEVARWNSVRGVTIHCIAVGQDHPLLKGLAEDSGGKYVRVN